MPAFLNTSGPVGEEEVLAFERRHGVRLPPAYRGFLLETNGGAPKPNRVAGTKVEYLYSLAGSRDFVDLEYAQGSFSELPALHIAIGTDPVASRSCSTVPPEPWFFSIIGAARRSG